MVTATVLPLPTPFFSICDCFTLFFVVFLLAQLSPEAVFGALAFEPTVWVSGVRSMVPPCESG